MIEVMAIKIIARKHDRSFHRSWEYNTILVENETEIIGVNNKTLVTNKDLSTFTTKNRSLFYFSKESWFNIIHIDDEKAPYYYCNISSPFEKEGDTLTYIDYDIDIKVDSHYNYEILDLDEYEINRKFYNYSTQLDKRIRKSMKELIKKLNNKELIFLQEKLNAYYKEYELKSRRKYD